MRNAIAFASTLTLLILLVDANEKLHLANDSSSETIESLIRSDSGNSAKPELGTLQKPILFEDAAKSQAEETRMNRIEVLAERKNVSKHDSPRHQIMGANDNTYNGPVLQSDSALAPGNELHSGSVYTSGSTKSATSQQVPEARHDDTNKSLIVAAHPSSLSNHATGSNEEMAIIRPIVIDEISDIVGSVLFESTEAGITDLYAEQVVAVTVIQEDATSDVPDGIAGQSGPETNPVSETYGPQDAAELPASQRYQFIGGFDVIVSQPEPEASSRLFPQDSVSELVASDITGVQMPTAPQTNSSWPIQPFDFLVFDENTSIPCILLTINITLSIPYQTKDHKTNTTEYQVPNALIATGQCANQHSSLTLSWFDSFAIAKENSITLNFLKDSSSFYLDSMTLNITLDPHHFPNAKDAFISGNSSTNLKLFSASVQNGIHVCPTGLNLFCGKILANINNVAVIAYNKNQELSSRKEEYCHVAPPIIQQVNIAGIIGGIVGVLVAFIVVAILLSFYRRKSDMILRSELP